MTVTEAVILAAGEGHRLRPLTKYQPKPMLPVANRPTIDYVFDALRKSGIERVVVVVGHRSDRIQTHLTSRYPGIDVTFVHQRPRLGSGHALRQAAKHIGDPFLVLNGDTLVDDAIVRTTVERYESTDSSATVAVAESETPEEYGVVLVDRGVISDIHEHPRQPEQYLVNAGVYVFDGEVFDALDSTHPRAGELRLTDAIAELDGPVTSVLVNGAWLDPATPSQLLSVTETVLARTGESHVDPTARVHETAVIEGNVAVGADCEVCAGAVVRSGTCLQENVRVGPNAVVERSVLFTDARVGAGAVFRDSVVGVGARIADGVVSPGDAALTDEYADRFGSVIADRAVVGANATLAPGCRIGPEATVRPGVTVSETIDEGLEVTA